MENRECYRDPAAAPPIVAPSKEPSIAFHSPNAIKPDGS
jgi:hypothetical protein